MLDNKWGKLILLFFKFDRGKADHWMGNALESCTLYSWSLGILLHWRPSVVSWSQCLQGSLWWGDSTNIVSFQARLSLMPVIFLFECYNYRNLPHVCRMVILGFHVSGWWKTVEMGRVIAQTLPTLPLNIWKTVTFFKLERMLCVDKDITCSTWLDVNLLSFLVICAYGHMRCLFSCLLILGCLFPQD